jgi:hypothetical protein
VTTMQNEMRTVFWDVAQRSLVVADRRFTVTYCLGHQGELITLIMETVRTSETSVYSNETTLRYIPEDCSYLLSCILAHIS